MAIVEAASCGLQVVSTRVGGIPEVLPPNLIHLTDATVESLYNGLMTAIHILQNERKKAQRNEHEFNHNGTIQSANTIEGVNSLKRSAHQDVNSNEPTAKRKVLCPYECNEILRQMYNWNNITERTERVYQRVLKEKDPPFGDKLNSYLNACIPFVLVVSFSYLLLKFLDIIEPRKYIDLAVETPITCHKRKKKKYS